MQRRDPGAAREPHDVRYVSLKKISYSHSQTKAFDNLRLRCISYSDCMDTVSGRELPNPLRDGVPVRVYGAVRKLSRPRGAKSCTLL